MTAKHGKGQGVYHRSKCLAIADAIVQMVAPRQIILFGSAARHERPPNDLDFLIVMPSGSDCRAIAQELYRNLPRRGLAIDLVVVSENTMLQQAEDDTSVIYQALQHGQVLYAA